MTRIHLVAVGACAIDTILTVPYFPDEDSKLRALSLTKRRGGNCPNSLEVLLQLVDGSTAERSKSPPSEDTDTTGPSSPHVRLSLIASLPALSSPQIAYVASSLELRRNDTAGHDAKDKVIHRAVDISRCIYREAYQELISSYIISSQATSSRTIVNHNELPEMTFEEFVSTTSDILPLSVIGGDNGQVEADSLWFHFEGRIPETTLRCIQYLQKYFDPNESTRRTKLRVSVELEKPQREGLQELAYHADIVFYSRSWAEAEGYRSANACLQEQCRLLLTGNNRLRKNQTLVCTWSDQGACALQIPPHDNHFATEQEHSCDEALQPTHRPAYIDRNRPVLDTVGAGDAFIAGMLFGFTCRGHNDIVDHLSTLAREKNASKRQPVWSLQQTLEFANGLAGRKVLQHGFQGLGAEVGHLIHDLDHRAIDRTASAIA